MDRGIVLGLCGARASRHWEFSNFVPARVSASDIKSWKPDIAVVGTGCDWKWSGRLAPKIIAVNNDFSAHGVVSILTDDHAIGSEAATHLLAKGLRHVAVFEPQPHEFVARRAEGVAEVCRRRDAVYLGIGCPHVEQVISRHSLIQRRIQNWLRTLPTPCGIVVGCDVWGALVVFNVLACGLRIPEDIAVLSIDNDELRCEMVPTPLSSVKIPWREMGVRVAKIIDDWTLGIEPNPQRVWIGPTGVQERYSSDMLAVEDPDVRDALTVIRSYAGRPLAVRELVRRLPVDRRRLERNFKSRVGRTLRCEIQRVHIEQARRLLSGTQLPMPSVAEKSGFSNSTLLGIAFRKETGMTPSQYRKRFAQPR